MEIHISVGAVAWYAATVATAGFVVSALSFLRDRPRLVLRANRDYVMVGGDGRKLPGVYVLITAANAGRRPITVTSVSLKLPGHHVLAFDSTKEARSLGEGTSASWLVDQDGLDPACITAVCACDATGRVWRRRVRWAQKR
jgi:hypothetical protein